MKHQAYFLKILLPVLAVTSLIGLAWGYQSIQSALAQHTDSIPPVAYAGPDQAVHPGSAVTLDGSGSYDPDNELPLSYLWAQTGGPAVTITPTLSVTAFTAPANPIVLTFTLVVTDSAGMPDPTPDEVVIRVLGQPVAKDDRGAGFTTDEDTPFVTADVLANDADPGGAPLSVESFDTRGTLGLVSFNGGGDELPGSLDTSGFGAPNGYVTIDFGGYENFAQGVAIQTDGKIVVAGTTFIGITDNDFALMRYNPDGSPDISFGTNGVVVTDFAGAYDRGEAVAIQTDNKIIVVGEALIGNYYEFAMARYNSDGGLDETFDGDGKVTTNFGSSYNIGEDVAIQPNGKIVIAGYAAINNYDFALARYNYDGSLDTTFGSGGKTTSNCGGGDEAYAIALQPNGKIVAAGYTDDGYTTKFAIASYNTNGSPDIDFGSNGLVTTTFFGLYDEANAVAVQPDGKIIAAGCAFHETSGDTALARYNPDGSLDASFGNDGKVTTDVNGLFADAYAIAIQTDGRILIAGHNCYSHCDSIMVRYSIDGNLDATFGTNGIAISDFSEDDAFSDMKLQPDGMIVAVGNNILARYIGNTNSGIFSYDPNGQFASLSPGEIATDTFTYVVTNGVLTDTAVVSITIIGVDSPPIAVDDRGPAFTTDEDTPFVTGDVLANDTDPEGQPLSVQSFDTTGTRGLVTFNGGSGAPPGSLDIDTFGVPNGYVIIPMDNFSDASGIVIQSDQKIIVAGTVSNPDNSDFYLARFNTDGSTDQTFGNAGIVTTDFSNNDDIGNALAIQPDDKIIFAGSTYNGNDSDFALARYNPDGSLDDSFGTGGKVTTNFNNYDFILDLVVNPNGKIVAVGYMTNGSNYDFAVVQYNPDGSLDTTFGVGGLVMTDFGQQDYARAVAIHNDQIVVAGRTMGNMGENCDFAVARYNPDGSLDTTFGNGGLMTTDFVGGTDMGMKVAIQADGLIIVAGDAGNSVDYDFGLARYMLDGNLDPTFGNDGRVITDLGSSDGITGLAIQSNGQIVSAGYTFIDSITVFTLARYNPDGSLDTNFGIDGIGTTNIGNNQANAMTIQSDGKIVMTGSNVLARFIGQDNGGAFAYDPNGQFETLAAGQVATDTFTYVVSDGVLTDTATVSITVTGVNDPPVAVDDSGSDFTTDADTAFVTGIVTANDQDIDGDALSVASFDTSGTRGLVTYNAGGGGQPGSLDVNNFGAPKGFVTTDFGGTDIGNDVALQPDGKIVVGGLGSSDLYYDFALARYNPDGSPDTTFGDAGKVLTDFGGNVRSEAVAIQPDGKIILAGYTDYSEDFALARYNTDGSPDITFGGNGRVTTDLYGSSDYAHDMALQTDGKIVVAGFTWQTGTQFDFALVRYNPDGSLDATFDSDGKVTTDFGNGSDSGYSIAILPDGKILVSGATYVEQVDFAAARYNPDGSLDDTFGVDGKVTTDFGATDVSYGMVIQRDDGKIVLAGYTSTYPNPADWDIALARYETNGDLDPSFGTGGKVITDFGIGVEGYDLAIQANHKIIVAGTTLGDDILYDYALARYNPDGSLDTSFGTDGRVTTDFFNGEDNANAIVIQPDGQIIVAGGAWEYVNPGFDFTVARYNTGGGTFTYDPNGQFDYLSAGEIATDTFTYVVSDGVLTDTATVSITVIGTGTGINNSPLFTSTPVTTAVATLPYIYTITTSDLDAGDLLTITAPTLPEWLTLTDHGDRSAALHGTPPAPGSYPVILQVTDGLSSATQAFTITVSPNPVNPVADLSVTQAFQWTSSSSAVFTLTVTNLGPDAAPGAIVSDTFPASFASVTWTCVGSGGATCSSNGSGNIADTLASFPAGGVVTYTVTVGNIFFGSWMNVAEVVTPSGISDPVPANNRSTFRFDIVQIFLPVIVR